MGGSSSFVIFFYWHWVYPTWHSLVLVIGDLLMIAVWYYGYLLARKEKITASVTCFGVGVCVQGVAGLLLLDGFEIAAFCPMLAGTVYAGLLDKRPLYICIGLSVVAPPVAELVKWYGLYELVKVPPEYLFVPTAGMISLVGGFILFFILRSQSLSQRMFRSLADANRDQRQIISTIQDSLPGIGRALQRVEKTSTKIAAQSGQLATVTSQINGTMTLVAEKAMETANTARETSSVAENTYQISMKNFGQFSAVEVGFEKGTKIISEAAFEVTQLASQVERIEEILSINRQIGEQITLLAVNATIEADEAGVYGKVFGEVAREFKAMIQDTENNLTHSRTLLHAIRDQARENALALVEGAKKLKQYFEELKDLEGIVEENLARFHFTAEQLAEIDDAAKIQQRGVQEVGAAISEINRATVHLNQLSSLLEKNVAQIGMSGKQLRETLDAMGNL